MNQSQGSWIKAEFYEKCNLLKSTVMKDHHKTGSYTKLCEGSWSHMENNRNGIKTVIPIKYITTEVSYLFQSSNRIFANPTAMNNILKDFFTSVDEEKKQISLFHTNITQTTYAMQMQIFF